MQPVNSPCEGWVLDRVLGTGGFGKVQLWTHVQSGNKLAIKECKWDTKQLTETQRRRWTNEVEIMQRLCHPNIVRTNILPFKVPNPGGDLPVLCMEYCSKGDLRKVLNKPENCCGVSEEEAITVMKHISSAVEYLHSKNITHRDLKPENIVLQNESDRISYKLIDLGYAKDLGEASTSASIVGTLHYVAPELLWNKKYSCSVDYWSLGILFYELVTGIRPFLPNMQHTMKWMQYIKNKGYDDICAFEAEGDIIFGKDIQDPTHISRCFRDKLVEWFRVVLQWDPKKRGKQCDENGVAQLAVFKLLNSILSKKIVYIFLVPLYKIYAYEVTDSTSIVELQHLIEKDTNIPMNQQTLTDYVGKVLTVEDVQELSKIHVSSQDEVLFLFKNGNTFTMNAPVVNIPPQVQKMMQLSRNHVDFETLKDYYRATVFFVKSEAYLFQLYIFALSIKVDLVISKVNALNENITNTLTNTNTLLKELYTIRGKWEKEAVEDGRRKALERNFEKVVKLINAADQIKCKFIPLIEESNELKNAAQRIDCIREVSQRYDKILTIYETFKKEHVPKGAKPTEMVKLVFQFLKVRQQQLESKSIIEIIRQISKLEAELLTLERIFDSVIAMETVYREELQNIIQSIQHYTTRHSPSAFSIGSQCLNASMTAHNESGKQVTPSVMQISSQSCSSRSPNLSMFDTDADKDVIYDNLVIRYTLDNLLVEMQKKYYEMISLDP